MIKGNGIWHKKSMHWLAVSRVHENKYLMDSGYMSVTFNILLHLMYLIESFCDCRFEA
jgi:hypothetical protein